MSEQRRLRGDDGSALVMALVFVTVVGLVVSAMLSQTSTQLKTTAVVRATTDKTYAADAGVEHAIESLRLQPNVCADPGAAESLGSITVNDHTVDMQCQTIVGQSSGASGWAVIITGTASNSFDVTGGSDEKVIDGPMYAANLGSYNKDWAIENGALYEGQSTGGCNLATTVYPDANVDVRPNPPFSYHCTTDGVPAIDHDLPDARPTPTDVAPAVDAGCRIFSPGTYTAASASVLNAATDKYFKSGTYYFEDVGTWTVDGTVIAGEADISESPTVDPGACENQTDAGPGTGAKFIFGGSTRLEVSATGNHVSSMEIFRRAEGADTEGEMGFGIQAVETTGGGFLASTVPNTTSLVTVSGNAGEFITHGAIYAPLSHLHIFANKTEASFQGGIVVRTMDLESSANISGLVVASAESPEVREIVVTATAQGKDGSRDIVGTAVLSLFNNNDRTFKVTSWRIE